MFKSLNLLLYSMIDCSKDYENGHVQIKRELSSSFVLLEKTRKVKNSHFSFHFFDVNGNIFMIRYWVSDGFLNISWTSSCLFLFILFNKIREDYISKVMMTLLKYFMHEFLEFTIGLFESFLLGTCSRFFLVFSEWPKVVYGVIFFNMVDMAND